MMGSPTAITLPFTEREIEGSIIARWRRVVEHYADRVAVTTVDGNRYTYAELDRASNQLAHALLDTLGPTNCPIVLLLDHSYSLIVSIIGTLKAGKAYVAFDSNQTAGQLQLLNQTTAAPVIVTNHQHHALAEAIVAATSREVAASQQIWVLESLPDTDRGCPNIPLTADTIAGIFFTSGTIKQPKGVARPHRIILHRSWFGAAAEPLAPSDNISGVRQCGLGGGMADLFNALLYGATYCLYDLRRGGLQELSTWLQREQITYFHPPIVLFRQWLDSLAPDEFYPHLRYILPSGRKTTADLEKLWPHVQDGCKVLLSYSSTETTQITSTAVARDTSLTEGVLHVGAPLPGKQVTVVDEDGTSVPTGEVGEIVVRSRYIATGYWQQLTLTAERFVSANDGSGETIYRTGDFGRFRHDGYLELVGRRDSQVKLRGYRVVLDEVEDALRALPQVQEAVVTVDEARAHLLAYLVPAIDPPTPPATIRTTLAQRFPDYALPTHVIYLPHFPLLPSGKINRHKLPAPEGSRPNVDTPYVLPRTPMEADLVAIWEEALGVQPVGVMDRFPDLGGNSLRAMQVHTRIANQIQNDLPIRMLFECATIAEMALRLTEHTVAKMPSQELEDLLTAVETLDTTNRFTDKATNYRNYRWRYAPAALEVLRRQTGLSPTSIVADIGSGTGELGEELACWAGQIFAVEPNLDMRDLSHQQLGHCSHIQIVAGSAEETTLPDHSVDLIVVGNALHWFSPQATKREFLRILRPGGWLAILSNSERKTHPTLWAAVDATRTPENGWIKRRYAIPPYTTLVKGYFSNHNFQHLCFPARQIETWEAFFGRLCSLSSAPRPDHQHFAAFEEAAYGVFKRFCEDDSVLIPYQTELFLGKLSS